MTNVPDNGSYPRSRDTRRAPPPLPKRTGWFNPSPDDQQARVDLAQVLTIMQETFTQFGHVFARLPQAEQPSWQSYMESQQLAVIEACRLLTEYVDARMQQGLAWAVEASDLRRERDEALARVQDLEGENRQLRESSGGNNDQLHGMRQALARLSAISDSKVGPEEVQRRDRRIQQLEAELQQSRAGQAQASQATAGSQQELGHLSEELQQARLELEDARRTVKRLQDEAARVGKQAEGDRQAAEEARREAEKQKEIAVAARGQVADLQSATRLQRNGVPFLLIGTTQDIVKGRGKTPDELLKMVPAPELAPFLLRLAEALCDHLGKPSPQLGDLRSVAATVRQTFLDPYFDPQAPLAQALKRGVDEARLWFGKLHQHLLLLDGQYQRAHANLGVAREEHARVREEADLLKRDAEAAQPLLEQAIKVLRQANQA